MTHNVCHCVHCSINSIILYTFVDLGIMLLRSQLTVGLHHGLDSEQLTADVEQDVVHVLHLMLETFEILHLHLIVGCWFMTQNAEIYLY